MNDHSKARAREQEWCYFTSQLNKGAEQMACNNKCNSRAEALYLLQELGLDTTILQGTPRADNLALDDVQVVQNFKQQLSAKLDTFAAERLNRTALQSLTMLAKQRHALVDTGLISKQQP